PLTGPISTQTWTPSFPVYDDANPTLRPTQPVCDVSLTYRGVCGAPGATKTPRWLRDRRSSGSAASATGRHDNTPTPCALGQGQGTGVVDVHTGQESAQLATPEHPLDVGRGEPTLLELGPAHDAGLHHSAHPVELALRAR